MTKLLTALLLAATALTANAAEVFTTEEAKSLCDIRMAEPLMQAQLKVYTAVRNAGGSSSRAYYATVRYVGSGLDAVPTKSKYFFWLTDAIPVQDIPANIHAQCVEHLKGITTD